MKKYILLLTFIVFSAAAISQPTHDYIPQRFPKRARSSNEDYLAKSRRITNAAIALVSGGLAGSVVGYVLIANSQVNYNSNSGNYELSSAQLIGGLLFIAGVSCVITSIPLFIVGGVLHHKAIQARVSMKLEGVPSVCLAGIPLHPFPALGLKIPLK